MKTMQNIVKEINYRRVLSVALCIAVVSTTFYFYSPIARSLQMTMIDPRKAYACLSFEGRLANHIFQYASIYGIARLNNLTILLGEDDDLVQYFKVPSAEVHKNRQICKSFTEVREKTCCSFDPLLMNLTTNDNYLFRNFLQSWKYFYHVKDEVRRELEFKTLYKNNAATIVDKYRFEYESKHSAIPEVVGIHIRRGDLLSKEIIDVGLIVPNEDYFYRSMNFFLEKYHHVVFIICTDTVDFALNLMKGRNETLHLVHNTAIQDLAVLSACDHVIMSVTSFSWISGFLSRGNVTYFKEFAKEGSSLRKAYNDDDYFPPEWHGL